MISFQSLGLWNSISKRHSFLFSCQKLRKRKTLTKAILYLAKRNVDKNSDSPFYWMVHNNGSPLQSFPSQINVATQTLLFFSQTRIFVCSSTVLFFDEKTREIACTPSVVFFLYWLFLFTCTSYYYIHGVVFDSWLHSQIPRFKYWTANEFRSFLSELNVRPFKWHVLWDRTILFEFCQLNWSHS